MIVAKKNTVSVIFWSGFLVRKYAYYFLFPLKKKHLRFSQQNKLKK